MRTAVGERQLAALRWIADGCPAGVMYGEAYKISAAALRSRELIRTSGRGDLWLAEITDRGRAYLAGSATGQAERGSARPDRRNVPSKTEQLVADVMAAGGQLALPDETAAGGVNWRQRAYAAQRHGKVPAGKHLAVSRNSDEFVISLEDGLTGNELGAEELPLPVVLAGTTA